MVTPTMYAADSVKWSPALSPASGAACFLPIPESVTLTVRVRELRILRVRFALPFPSGLGMGEETQQSDAVWVSRPGWRVVK